MFMQDVINSQLKAGNLGGPSGPLAHGPEPTAEGVYSPVWPPPAVAAAEDGGSRKVYPQKAPPPPIFDGALRTNLFAWQVTVLRADLPDKMDVLVRFKLRDEEKKAPLTDDSRVTETPVVKGKQRPEWNATTSLQIADRDRWCHVELWEKHMIRSDSLIGSAVFYFDPFATVKQDREVHLDVKHKEKPVTLFMRFLPAWWVEHPAADPVRPVAVTSARNKETTEWEAFPTSGHPPIAALRDFTCFGAKGALWVWGGAKQLPVGNGNHPPSGSKGKTYQFELRSNALWRLPLDTKRWEYVEQSGVVPCPRTTALAALVPDESKLYLYGGIADPSRELKCIYELDIATATWTPVFPTNPYGRPHRDPPCARMSYSNGKLHLFDKEDMTSFDLGAKTWGPVASITTKGPGFGLDSRALHVPYTVCSVFLEKEYSNRKKIAVSWILDHEKGTFTRLLIDGAYPPIIGFFILADSVTVVDSSCACYRLNFTEKVWEKASPAGDLPPARESSYVGAIHGCVVLYGAEEETSLNPDPAMVLNDGWMLH